MREDVTDVLVAADKSADPWPGMPSCIIERMAAIRWFCNAGKVAPDTSNEMKSHEISEFVMRLYIYFRECSMRVFCDL